VNAAAIRGAASAGPVARGDIVSAAATGARGARGPAGEAGFTHQLDGSIDVAIGFDQRLFTLHHTRACALAKLFY